MNRTIGKWESNNFLKGLFNGHIVLPELLSDKSKVDNGILITPLGGEARPRYDPNTGAWWR